MATPSCLIRPAGSLAKSHPLLYRLNNGLSITSGPVGALWARRGFSGTVNVGKDKTVQAAAEGDVHQQLVQEAEKKRIEAQDAALKEILDNAAAEKRKLEERTIVKAAEERARLAAKEEAEKQAAERLQRQQEQQQQSLRPTQTTPLGHVDSTAPKSTANNTSLSSTSTNSQQDNKAGSTSSSSGQDTSIGSSIDGTGAKNTLGEQPTDLFKARLLPYKKSLESSTEYIRSALPDTLRQLSESVKRKDYRDTITQLSEHLNAFTGYNAVNDLKQKVITHGDNLDGARIKLVQAKQTYETAISTRSDTQKAINDLLQRKHLWSPDDVIRFTDLYRSEHANEQAEQWARTEYKQAEADVESKSRMLTKVIMERYHEEQVWSDKIRAASTYGTWGLIGMNVMAFLIVQAFVEPRRRRKQVERYEELVQDLTERGVLPDKLASTMTSGGTAITLPNVSKSQSSDDTAVSQAGAPVAVGGALLGGEDILEKMMQSVERQEERLDRVENLLLKQEPGVINGSSPTKFITTEEREQGTPKSGEFVLGEDGAIMFLNEDEGASVDMEGAWRDELARGRGSGNASRLSLILKNGDAEVPATRRDFLLSGFGGALIGGLVTVVVMLNR
ncbi:sensitivity to high expression protein she9 [Dissophora globulifera]|uniref:Sensitive to high expression protein 9, mitochondrial n=1 Tax=Dissophora globulifera TaxID=979702 RepID=A0A9P6RNE4_9FUNG|nr:sensitivity to high expression protein she9 [Dissophora globulifera]